MEQIEIISNDIRQKLSEVREGSDAHKFLLIKQKIIDDSIIKILKHAQINKYEYELYILFDKCEFLRSKISMKEHRPTDDDEDIQAYKHARDRMSWIRETKMKWVNFTYVP